jgi:hypothetical protein
VQFTIVVWVTRDRRIIAIGECGALGPRESRGEVGLGQGELELFSYGNIEGSESYQTAWNFQQ